ncbi:hypothetical protein V6N12_052373 [Hibiscus sabdariffa]|uniref:Alpha/beta hydrolase fold-3 domain-containing protein n=1 Tax=Hibiscus sabdariffa TaxID=183260 RepID=A0ABR2GJ21_9ROSI
MYNFKVPQFSSFGHLHMSVLIDAIRTRKLESWNVYFHGGGFASAQPLGLATTIFCGDFSVHYRLAPGHRLPIAYDDCYSSLEWLHSQVTNEPWLTQADLPRMFLTGDGACRNIVHQLNGEFPAMTVYVAGFDFLKERGVMYAEFLQRKEVKMVN